MLSPAGSFPLPGWEAPSDIVAAIANEEPALFIAFLAPTGGYVSQYTLDGKLRLNWKMAHIPSGLDFDPNTDIVYVASYDSAEIYQASIRDHNQMLRYCGPILGARQLGPLIVDDSRNQLLVGEVENGQVYSFDLKTRKSHLLASDLGSPQALLLSTDRRQLFIADAVRRKIYRLDLSNPNAPLMVFSAEAVYKEPVGLALLSSGYIVVADDRADALFILSPSGVLQH